jgi:aminopeptidase-like protein
MQDILMENRSIVGPGYDRALARVGEELALTVHEFPTGSDVWTWRVPEAWDVREAWFEANGNRYADFAEHPLHLWSFSLPFEGTVSREELLRHITSNPQRPDAIPFDFRYYQRDWGFCLAHRTVEQLDADEYHVHIDAQHFDGALKVGEHVIEGDTEDSVLIVCHLDHAGQANDDLAGVAVSVEAARRLAGRRRRLTLRFLYVPEQIGTIAYLSRHEDRLDSFRHGLFLEMLGNDQPLALQHSKRGDDAIDRAVLLALQSTGTEFIEGRFLEVIVNDEQVMDGPGVDVPTVSLSRATPPPQSGDSAAPNFHSGLPYPEYHTSDDSLDILVEERLEESVQVVIDALDILDADLYPRRTYRGPVQLSRHGLWVDWRVDPRLNEQTHHIMWCLEGDKSISEIALETSLPFSTVHTYVERFREAGLVKLAAASWTP